MPLAWSSNYLIARAAAGVISPHTLALGRWSLTVALMLVLMLPLPLPLALAWPGARCRGPSRPRLP